NYLVDILNSERRCKIITIEDPIEYVHENKRAIVVQQEVLTDTHSFNRALVHGLRQDPDVIVVGEVRDHEAIATALKAAETGHLVLATLHSPNVALALERIVGVFEGSAQRQIVLQLANALQGIIAQELLPSVDRSRRVLAYELLVANSAVRNLIRENNLHQLENCIQTGGKDGMVLMDACLYDLYSRCQISYDTALGRARNPDRIAKRASQSEDRVSRQDKRDNSMNSLTSKISTVLEIILCAGIIGWVLYRWLKKSDDPAGLISKRAVTAVMAGITGWVAASNSRGGGVYGAAFIIGISCAIFGIVLG